MYIRIQPIIKYTLTLEANLVEDVKVDVLNIAGQKIISKIYKSLQLEKGIDLSLHNLDAGIYLIRCEAADWKQSTKFIKKIEAVCFC